MFILALDFDWREELTRENTEEIKDRFHCPTINVLMGNLMTWALVDSGSQLSCISENFYESSYDQFTNCPFWPVVGTSIVGATRGRPVKLKKQIYVEITLGKLKTKKRYLWWYLI